MDDVLVPSASASAFWALQISHLKQSSPSRQGSLFGTDKFYTLHVLAEHLKLISDNELISICKVSFNNIESFNLPSVKIETEEVKNESRGTWRLFKSFNRPPPTAARRGRQRFGAVKTVWAPNLAKNCGFIVWKDLNVVLFYCNDMEGTPTVPVMEPCDLSRNFVQGITSITIWMENKSMNLSFIELPSLVLAYNIFMNGVDWFDQ